jgi:hypothetical protein
MIDNAIKYTTKGSFRVVVKLVSKRHFEDLECIESIDSIKETPKMDSYIPPINNKI